MSTETSNTGQSLQLNAPLGAPAANPGQFKKGQSGNPAGRPRGARNRATLMIAALLDEEGPRLMREAIDRALDGDSLLLRCCVTRMVPVPRGRPVELDLAEGSAAGDVLASMTATVRAMAEGALSPLEAADVAAVLEGQRRAIESCDLDRRLSRLEAAARMVDPRGLERADWDEDEEDKPSLLPDSVLDASFDAPADAPADPPDAAAPARPPS
jgi:hypothetical protein